MHFNHIEIMLIHQKYESQVVEGDPGSLPGRGVDVDVLVQKQLEQERQTVVLDIASY
jgi:hypothetical protein